MPKSVGTEQIGSTPSQPLCSVKIERAWRPRVEIARKEGRRRLKYFVCAPQLRILRCSRVNSAESSLEVPDVWPASTSAA
jgi:hypothetical protein